MPLSVFWRASLSPYPASSFLFFFNDPATTEIYTLSLHDALPICSTRSSFQPWPLATSSSRCSGAIDRKSTRLNSSHLVISYAVFCLKKSGGYGGAYSAAHAGLPGGGPAAGRWLH